MFRKRRGEHGYALLYLLLLVALIAIAAGIAAPTLAFEIRRDREEELIHRGVQYSRAIRRFVKTTGRYPNRVDELVGSEGNARYLRRRYIDPVTKKDFRLLSIDEVMRAAGQVPPVNATPGTNGQGNLGAPTPGATDNNPQAANPNGPPDASADATSIAVGNNANGGVPTQNAPGSANASSSQSGQVINPLIAGVASTSKDQTIREFNHKKHYNEWLFFYQPAFDRGYVINAPTPLTPVLNQVAGPNPPSVQQAGAQYGSPQTQQQPSAQPPPAQ